MKWWFGKEIEIPEEWGIMKFERIAEFLAGYAFSSKDYSKKGIQLLRQGNLQDRKLNLEKEPVFLDNSFEKEYPEYIIRSRDIVVSLTGTMTKRDYGYAVLIPNNTSKLFLNQRMAKITPNEAIISEFLTYLMNHRYFEDQFYRLEAGTKQANVSLRDVKKLNLFCPAILEQKKIVSILSNVDNLISLYEDTIQATKKVKQGLMQQLLTKGIGHKKFKKKYFGFGKEIQFPEEWRIEKLKENSSKIGSGVTPLGGSEVYLTKGIPLIRSQNIHFDGLHLDNVVYITEQIHDKMKNSKLKPNDILLNITGASIGRCTIFPDNLGEANVNQHVCIIRSKSSLLPSFLNYFMASSLMQNIINSVQVGLSRQGLNFKDLGNFLIPIPNSNEQQKIASILSSVDDKITELESKKKSLESLKKGLMQKLLTGQIRVSVPN